MKFFYTAEERDGQMTPFDLRAADGRVIKAIPIFLRKEDAETFLKMSNPPPPPNTSIYPIEIEPNGSARAVFDSIFKEYSLQNEGFKDDFVYVLLDVVESTFKAISWTDFVRYFQD